MNRAFYRFVIYHRNAAWSRRSVRRHTRLFHGRIAIASFGSARPGNEPGGQYRGHESTRR